LEGGKRWRKEPVEQGTRKHAGGIYSNTLYIARESRLSLASSYRELVVLPTIWNRRRQQSTLDTDAITLLQEKEKSFFDSETYELRLAEYSS
jgi:hypothetical protein